MLPHRLLQLLALAHLLLPAWPHNLLPLLLGGDCAKRGWRPGPKQHVRKCGGRGRGRSASWLGNIIQQCGQEICGSWGQRLFLLVCAYDAVAGSSLTLFCYLMHKPSFTYIPNPRSLDEIAGLSMAYDHSPSIASPSRSQTSYGSSRTPINSQLKTTRKSEAMRPR